MIMELNFSRPDKLNLLTEDELVGILKKDLEADKHINDGSDSWVWFDTHCRKYRKHIYDAKQYWDAIYKLNTSQFYELIQWLSVADEPVNPTGVGRPGKVKELARVIKYNMTQKQRQTSYRIIEQRFNKLKDTD